MTAPPPLRFLGLVIAGWVCVRVAMIGPDWLGDPPLAAAPVALQREQDPGASPPAPVAVVAAMTAPIPSPAGTALVRREPRPVPLPPFPRHPASLAEAQPVAPLPPMLRSGASPAPAPQLAPVLRPPAVSRWSASAWAFLRRGEAPRLATGGSLGGSQTGARIAYRIDGALSVQARAYSPLGGVDGAEAALGLEWKPLASVPVRLVAERRQALGSTGRSAFSLFAHGGVGEIKAGPLTVEAYAQAGMVGARRRDLFADGSIAVALPLDHGIKLGGALWGGAQPGAARMDAGPQVSVRLPGAARRMRLVADWRFRIAGESAPGSGPALTLATDF